MGKADRVDFFMPLYVRDFLTATIGWTATERGHYLTLLMIQWDREGLPAAVDQLEKLSAGVSEVWGALQEKFPIDADGQRRNARLEHHRGLAVDARKRRSEAGKVAAAARQSLSNGGAIVEQSLSNRGAIVEQSLSNGGAIVEQSLSNRGAIVKQPEPEPEPYPNPFPSLRSEDEISLRSISARSVRKRSRPNADSISWNPETGWQGVTDADRSAWAEAYPAVSIVAEMARAAEWLRANPAKARKSLWRKFLTGWMARSQERGGDTPSRPGGFAPPTPPDRKRYWRSEFDRAMTDAEFSEARANAARNSKLDAGSPMQALGLSPDVSIGKPR